MDQQTFKMYHGGQKWSFLPRELQPSFKSRYEVGVGIYFTNAYETAKRYAKGSRVVQIVDIDKNFKDVDNVKVPLKELLDFIKNVPMMKKKKEIMIDIVNYAKRTNATVVPLSVLNNLIVNYEVGAGKVGLEIAKFFVSKGGDACVQKQSGGEFWLVVFNPKIMKKVSVVDPKSKIEWMLPVPDNI